MGKFYQFIESKLFLEMNSEYDFIRQFFAKSNTNYDERTLVTFVDWLQDRNDPRSELLRLAIKNNLNSVGAVQKLANRLRIQKIDSGRILINGNQNVDVIRDALDRNLQFALSSENLSWYRLQNRVWTNIKLNEIPENIIEKFFWALVGYGWSQ